MIVKMPRSCWVESCLNNAKSQPNLNFWNFFIWQATASVFSASNWLGATASRFLHSSLVDQLYAKKVYFWRFATKSNQAWIKIHLNVYNSFYLTITHGESHGIFKSTSHRPSPYITPQHPIGAPLYFAKEALPSVASLFFLHQNPPSSFQKTRYRISISPEKPLHTLFLIFPLQTKFPFWR